MIKGAAGRSGALAWLVLGAALAVRLAYVAGWGKGSLELAGDARDYHSYAESLLDRGRYENSEGLRASRMPGYPLFLAGIYATLGRGVLAVQIAQCLLGSLTCLIVFFIAEDWLGRGWAPAAGLGSAFYYDLFSPCARILTEAPTTLLITLSLWLCARRQAPKPAQAAGAGLLAGGAFLLRSEMAPFACLLAALAFLRGKGPGRWKAPAALALAFALLAAPWALRNRRVLGRTVLATTAGSFNLYGWGVPRTVQERLGGLPGFYQAPDSMGELEKQDAYARAARSFYGAADPKVLLRAVILNLLIFYYPFLPQYDPTFILFLPWAFWGAWVGRRDPRAWPWALWIGYLSLLHVFVAVMGSRHRQKLSSAFILLACAGLKELAERLGPRALRRAVAGWAGVNLAVWACAPWLRQAALSIFKP